MTKGCGDDLVMTIVVVMVLRGRGRAAGGTAVMELGVEGSLGGDGCQKLTMELASYVAQSQNCQLHGGLCSLGMPSL